MYSAGLTDLLNFLASLDAAQFKSAVVDEYLKAKCLSAEEFSPFTHFREDSYGRNLVYKNSCFELIVLTWLSRQRTPIHDHDGQRCWMLLKQGELCFRNYSMPRKGVIEVNAMGPPETHKAGDCVYIDDTIGIHSIANASKEPAVSVHIYAGPVPQCQIYNESRRCFETVQLSYFTMAEVPAFLEELAQSRGLNR